MLQSVIFKKIFAASRHKKKAACRVSKPPGHFHPKLYAWLGHHFREEPEKAALVQSVIGTFGFTEGGLPYPLTAKYHMGLCGIPTALHARNRKDEELTAYGKSCMEQMKAATDALEAWLGL